MKECFKFLCRGGDGYKIPEIAGEQKRGLVNALRQERNLKLMEEGSLSFASNELDAARERFDMAITERSMKKGLGWKIGFGAAVSAVAYLFCAWTCHNMHASHFWVMYSSLLAVFLIGMYSFKLSVMFSNIIDYQTAASKLD